MEDKKQISTPMAIVVAGFLVMVGLMVGKMPAKNTNINSDQVAQEEDFVLEEVSSSDHVRGDLKTAQVVIVEYSDTECPFCKDFHNYMNQAFDQYGGKMAWVYRHFPLDSLHTKARKEAEATECVASLGGNDIFWQYLDMIFKTTNSNDSLDPALLPKFASELGVDEKKFNDCLSSGKFVKAVQDDFDSGVKAGVRGTPYSVVILDDGTQIPISGANNKALFETLETYIK